MDLAPLTTHLTRFDEGTAARTTTALRNPARKATGCLKFGQLLIQIGTTKANLSQMSYFMGEY